MSNNDLFVRVGGIYTPEATRDPQEAKEWCQGHRSGKVIRVDGTTEVADIELAHVIEHD